jgi:organic hydroperoxide reductase OsmC/OhrA
VAATKQLHYRTTVHWASLDGAGTIDYRSYTRDHTIAAPGKPPIAASADAAFRGNAALYNPEELLVASLSSCHMLWYLHLCAEAGVVVVDYRDDASGTLERDKDGSGHFTGVTLRPDVRIRQGDPQKALALHVRAHELCFIARSVDFSVETEPHVSVSWD